LTTNTALKLGLSMLAFTMLGMFATPQVHAETVRSSVSGVAQSNKTDNRSESIESVDKYVDVKSNQFVLNIPNESNLNNTTVVSAQNAINDANQEIELHHGVIDPLTKQITFRGDLDKRASHEVRKYWWGSRHIFRSNNAVDSFAYGLENESAALAVTSLFAGIAPTAGTLGGVGSLYFEKVASDLRHFNTQHSRSKIYMDINRALIYKIAVWHD